MRNFSRIGTLGLIAIVALRMGIGWHFFMEGTAKVKSGTFSSEGFLKSAEGRMAGLFHSLIWDYDGKIRLDEQLVVGKFKEASANATGRFRFTDQQIKTLHSKEDIFLSKLKSVYDEHSEAIFKYNEGSARVEKMNDSALWNQVASLRSQKEQITKDRLSAVMPAVESIQAIWNQYEKTLNSIATVQQRSAAGYFQFKRPGEGLITSRSLDRIIPIFDLTVGVLLIVGLMVPLASWLGAAFLLGVVLSQFPGDHNTQLTYFHAVEALALIVLASCQAGRFAGLDFFTWAWMQNRSASRTAAQVR